MKIPSNLPVTAQTLPANRVEITQKTNSVEYANKVDTTQNKNFLKYVSRVATNNAEAPGNTLEEILTTISNINKTLTGISSDFLRRLNQSIETVRERSTKQQELMKGEGWTVLAFGVAAGAASIAGGVVPLAFDANNPIANVVKTTCDAAAPILNHTGNAVATGYKARQEEERMRLDIERSIQLQASLENEKHTSQQRDALNTSAGQIVNSNQRSFG